MTKTKQFNIRIAENIYNEIKEKADTENISMTDFVIAKVTDDSSVKYEKFITELENELAEKDITIQKLVDEKENTNKSYTKLYSEQMDKIEQQAKDIQELENDSEGIDDSYKERYIEELNAQVKQQADAIQNRETDIQELHRLLDQQQQLTLSAQKEKEQLSVELDNDNKKWWKFWGN